VAKREQGPQKTASKAIHGQRHSLLLTASAQTPFVQSFLSSGGVIGARPLSMAMNGRWLERIAEHTNAGAFDGCGCAIDCRQRSHSSLRHLMGRIKLMGARFQPPSCSVFTATATACWLLWQPSGPISNCRFRQFSSLWSGRSGFGLGHCVEPRLSDRGPLAQLQPTSWWRRSAMAFF